MKGIIEIYRYTFKYKGITLLVIFFNLLYVIFNLISLALFVPFLQIIFNENDKVITIPIKQNGLINFFKYQAELFDYKMNILTQENPKEALFIACISIGIAFLGKNVFTIKKCHVKQLT